MPAHPSETLHSRGFRPTMGGIALSHLCTSARPTKSRRHEATAAAVAAFLLFASCSFGQGFRGFQWGTSPKDVMRIEGERSIFDMGNGLTSIDYLYIPGQTKTVNGFDAIVTFVFGKTGLVWGEYFIENRELAFLSLFDALTQKYGLPTASSRSREGLDSKEWITKDGITRIELAVVLGQKLPRLVPDATGNQIKSVRLRYYDEKASGKTRTVPTNQDRPDL